MGGKNLKGGKKGGKKRSERGQIKRSENGSRGQKNSIGGKNFMDF
jgi:hypothetical protein